MSGDVISISLAQQQDFQFRNDFGASVPPLVSDEPAPLGQGEGPAPQQLLLAAVANCLSASLLFALRKFKQQGEPLQTTASCLIDRNETGRLRVMSIDVTLRLGQSASGIDHLDRILGGFQEYCTVSQSVGRGIPIRVQVQDADGSFLM
ncbi:OsmC family protein [Pseudogulbenkiania sp. NH8B]|uniref:OsmC family protein n=1 Tax=Pseudogulbenkiania sp. (strain NH8B) TaxID=748280 RepID=UPI0002279D12|nr:OsmC family protein [Pseudogulbenkiania sp. NH8B]BAK77052.1 OsmC family protein [Pseudogulbenkiania sp. NH8B]